MKIDKKTIKIKDLCEGYSGDNENGVYSYGGKLNIRPPYQREFRYSEEQQKKVLDSVMKKYPLNTIYWSVNDDGTYEVIDGQQRILSICEYVYKNFSIPWDGHNRYFHSLEDPDKKRINNYELDVYLCEGTPKEKLAWFKVINIAGEVLTKQELLNATYSGPWISDARVYFSKRGCPAYQKAKDYMKGSPIKQTYLETVLNWKADRDGSKNIEDHMGKNRYEDNAKDLWRYFEDVIDWTEKIFTKYRPVMKGVPWGLLYNKHNERQYDSSKIEKEIENLYKDPSLTNHKGIYSYIFDNNDKHLKIRGFTEGQKNKTYEIQDGKCNLCSDSFDIKDMDADHKIAWALGGDTVDENCQMLCIECHSEKTTKDIQRIKSLKSRRYE